MMGIGNEIAKGLLVGVLVFASATIGAGIFVGWLIWG